MFRTVFVVLLSSLLFFPACRPQETAETEAAPTETAAPSAAPSAGSQGLLMRVETDGEPKVGTVPVVVYVLSGGEGVSGASVEVTGDMTHAGMAPVTAVAEELEPGLYRAEGFEFGMAGDWLLTAVATLPGGEQESAELGVTVPGQ